MGRDIILKIKTYLELALEADPWGVWGSRFEGQVMPPAAGGIPQTPQFFLTTAKETQETPHSRAKQGVRLVGGCVRSRFV